MPTIVETIISNNSSTSSSFSLTGIPAGGSTGQQLVKVSGSNYDVAWSTSLGTGDMLRSVYDPNNDGVISYNSLGDKPSMPLNRVVINTIADFTVQDATTITLEAGKLYYIGNFLSVSKRFIVEDGAALTSFNPLALVLEYTGTGVMFTSVNANFSVFDIRYSCVNGTVFDWQGQGILLHDRAGCLGCVNIGSLNSVGFGTVNVSNTLWINVTGQGWQMFGAPFVASFTRTFIQTLNPSVIGIDFGTAVFQNIEIENYEFEGVVGSIGVKAAPNSANLAPNKVGTISNCGLNGGGATPIVGITHSDTLRWQLEANSGVEDTMEDGLAHFRGNVTNTVIVNSSTDGSNSVKVNAVWTGERFSKFTFDSNGRVTYLGERPITLPVDVSLHLISVGGGSISATVYLYKYTASLSTGSILVNTGVSTDLSGSTSKNIYLPWQLTLNAGDYLEVWVENNTNPNDILVKQGTLRIR